MKSIAVWVDWFSRRLSVLAGSLTAIIVIIVCIDVASRLLLGRSVQGASEIAILLLSAVVFLGLAGAEAKGENFSVTILKVALGGTGSRWLETLTTLLSAVAIGLLAYYSWVKAVDATAANESSYGVIAFPVWPSRLIVACGLSMLALQLLAQLMRLVSGGRGRDD